MTTVTNKMHLKVHDSCKTDSGNISRTSGRGLVCKPKVSGNNCVLCKYIFKKRVIYILRHVQVVLGPLPDSENFPDRSHNTHFHHAIYVPGSWAELLHMHSLEVSSGMSGIIEEGRRINPKVHSGSARTALGLLQASSIKQLM